MALSGIGRVKPPRDDLGRTKIAYVMEPNTLAVMPFGGPATETLVPRQPAHIFEPAWFPDVEKKVEIVYGTGDQGTRSNDLFSISAEERTPPVNLTNTAMAEEYGPAWSPDGRKLAFWSNRNGAEGIYVSEDPADLHAPRLIYATNDTSGASWSPDGRKLAFATKVGNNWEIFVVDANGGRLDTLTHHPSNDRFPAWSPDGTQIAFSSQRDGNAEVYLMDADGDSLLNLSRDAAAYDAFPSWSPDGSLLAFGSQSYSSGSNLIRLVEPKTRVFGVPIQNASRPAWSPFLPIPVAFDFDPNTLQKSNDKGRVTGYVQLPPEYGNCGDIDPGTVRLNGTIAPILDEKYGFAKAAACADQNKDGIQEQMSKFERVAVAEKLEPPQGSLRVSGRLKNGKVFAGRDTVKVILPGKGQVKGNSAKLVAVPEVYFLSPCRPNPFNPTTHIDYGLPEAQKVRLAVYNALGQRIAILVDTWQDAGFYNVAWEARDLPTGMYFYQLQAGTFTQTRRMMLVK